MENTFVVTVESLLLTAAIAAIRKYPRIQGSDLRVGMDRIYTGMI